MFGLQSTARESGHKIPCMLKNVCSIASCALTQANEPKVGIRLVLISYLLSESFVLAKTQILFLVSLLFVAV